MRAIVPLLTFAALLLTAIAYLRPPEYDEAYSLFLTTAHAHPIWPTTPFTPSQVQSAYLPNTTPTKILQNLRTNDVHPPLYFWTLLLWREIFGPAWFTARLLSVLYATLSLAALARIAALTQTPVTPSILICLLTYGFAYTSILTRNFALAQLLTLLGVQLTLESRHPPTRRADKPGESRAPSAIPAPHKAIPPLTAPAAALCLGAATFTNDLTLFPALTALTHLRPRPIHVMPAKAGIHAFLPKSPEPRSNPTKASASFFEKKEAKKLPLLRAEARKCQSPQDQKFFASLPAWAFLQKRSAFFPFLLFLPPDAYLFTAQHHARPAQFTPFSLSHALTLLAKDSAAAWFGGLPLYAGPLAPLVTLLLITLAAACLFSIRRTQHTVFFAALTLSTPIGLLALGLIFNNTPIEIRYLAFSLPYLSLLLATIPPRLQTLLITVQSLAIIGLALAPATAQPQQRAARQAAALATPATLVLVPYGNDGVGIPGPFIAAAPVTMTVQLLHPDVPPDLTHASRLILATITIDSASRTAIAQTLTRLQTSACWRETSQTPLIRAYLDTCQQH